MFSFELFEAGKPRIIVTYPGRFQPFHRGHAGVFARLQKKFGSDNVFIATSNDQSSAKSPFNFTDKYQLMTAAGVPGDRIIETTDMYKLPVAFDPNTTVFVTAVGAPDAERLRPDTFLKRDNPATGKKAGDAGYFKTFREDEELLPASQHGYVVVIPEIKADIEIKGQRYDVSHGTECRNLWNAIRNDGEARKQFLTQLYGKASAELAQIFDKIPVKTAEDISDFDGGTTSPIHGFKEDAAGVGVVAANKKMAKDPRYSMSITKDVKPGTPAKMLRAFRLSEEIKKLEEELESISEKWSQKQRKSVNCNNPKGFSQRAHCAGRRARQAGKKTKSGPISEDTNISKEQMIDMVKKFLPLAMKELKLKKLPRIVLQQHIVTHDGQATFGRFVNDSEKIYVGIADRHPVDILRTLAHELVHFKQYEDGKMYPEAGETGSPIENEAHVIAGIIMRHFNKKYPDAVKAQGLEIS